MGWWNAGALGQFSHVAVNHLERADDSWIIQVVLSGGGRVTILDANLAGNSLIETDIYGCYTMFSSGPVAHSWENYSPGWKLM